MAASITGAAKYGWPSAFAAVAVLSLGPLWLVSRDVWDGVIASYGLATLDLSGIQHWLIPGNWDLMYSIFVALAWLAAHTAIEPWVGVKLLLSASVLGIAWEARQLALQLLKMPPAQAWAVAVLALSFPCWYLLYGSTFVYIVFVWWGFLGHRLLHIPPSRTTWRLLKFCLGGLLLLASFQVNSNFVMVFALEAARWLARDRKMEWRYLRSACICLSALAVYLTLRNAFPPYAQYVGYNNLIWPTSVAGLWAWLRPSLMFMTWLPLIAGPAGLIWLTRWIVRKNWPDYVDTSCTFEPGIQHNNASTYQTVCILCVLCFGAVFAYIAVGKGSPLFVINLSPESLGTGSHLGGPARDFIYTTVHGWSTRHTFLLSVPASLACIWLICLAIAKTTSQRYRNKFWLLGFAFALISQLAFQWHGHAAKHFRYAQEDAIVKVLQTDAFPTAGLLDIKIESDLPWTYWTYESNYLTWLAFGQTRWATSIYAQETSSMTKTLQHRTEILRDLEKNKTLPRAYYLMSDFEMSNCRTEWTLKLPFKFLMNDWITLIFLKNKLPKAIILRREQLC